MRPRARPEQAGFFRRFIAFVVDVFLITLGAVPLYVVYSEVRGALGGEPGIVTQLKAGQPGQYFYFRLGLESQERRGAKKTYLAYLRPFLSEEEYLRASKMSLEELKGAFHEELGRPDAPIVTYGGPGFRIIQELLVGYLYFILFFRLGGRTPGKRLLGLKVVDLRGSPSLTWYQAFERTHGYAASLLVGGIGFLQVLWDKGGLTMHDKLAGTTVVRLPKRPHPKPHPAPAAPTL
jgi:uncharacterized RDD family membrane protein YckC